MNKLENNEMLKLVKELENEGVTVIIEDAQENLQKTIVAGCRGGGGGSCSGSCGQGGGGGCRLTETPENEYMAKAA